MIPWHQSEMSRHQELRELFLRKPADCSDLFHSELRRIRPTRVIVMIFLLLLLPNVCHAKKTYLTITSEPTGASVELDQIVVGKTPYTVEIPLTYLKGSHYVMSKFLRHQIHLRLTFDGYLPKDVDLANGPCS
jgi:hypothetical protein